VEEVEDVSVVIVEGHEMVTVEEIGLLEVLEEITSEEEVVAMAEVREVAGDVS